MDKPEGFTTWATQLAQRKALEDLLEDAKLIEDLVETPGWRAVEGIVQERVEWLQERLYSTKKVLARSEYAALVSEINGLRQLKALAPSVLYAAELAEKHALLEGADNGSV